MSRLCGSAIAAITIAGGTPTIASKHRGPPPWASLVRIWKRREADVPRHEIARVRGLRGLLGGRVFFERVGRAEVHAERDAPVVVGPHCLRRRARTAHNHPLAWAKERARQHGRRARPY